MRYSEKFAKLFLRWKEVQNEKKSMERVSVDFEAGTILRIFLYIIHKFGLRIQLREKFGSMGSYKGFGHFPFSVHRVPGDDMVSVWADSEIAEDVGEI